MEDSKKTYLDTEFGKIPSDWVYCTFKDVLNTFSSGATPYRAIPEYYKGKIRWISSGELNYNVIYDTIEHISETAVKNTNLKMHESGTFLMAITGLEAEGTRGRCAIVGALSTTNQSCLALNGTKKLGTDYLFWFYRQWGDYLAFKYCQGTKQQSYTAAIVKKLPICCPKNTKEQTAIATALSDTDALIAALDKKIAKKQQIKQGAMQQLLTGKKRLPGFSGEWVEKSIWDIAEKNKSSLNDGDWIESPYITNEGIRLLQTGNIGIGLFKDKTEKKFISEESFDKLNCKEVLPNDILICRLAEPAGRTCLAPKSSTKMITSVDVSIFRPNEELYDRRFLLYILNTPEWFSEINDRCGGSTRTRIARMQLGSICINIPENKSEQTAIAQILTDMDKEIARLEKKRDKYKEIKAGMMQVLLTGRVRLV
jgi:type I restriction enzyme S subunit